MKNGNVLILPGWFNSDPAHWQSRWEASEGYVRVPQHDWERPLRGDWMMQLEEAVLAADEPVVLVAHSLGCALVAAWAAHSRETSRVKAALLVAPPDTSREELRGPLYSWCPVEMARFPWGEGRSVVIASQDDPYCDPALAKQLARGWGASFELWGNMGHVNSQSQLGDWPKGHAVLKRLMALPIQGEQ